VRKEWDWLYVIAFVWVSVHMSAVSYLPGFGKFFGRLRKIFSQRYFIFSFLIFFSRTYTQTCIECTQVEYAMIEYIQLNVGSAHTCAIQIQGGVPYEN